ncbi:hypothetical protein J132_08006 [Termitomyces sp. J132]|nr:hypothetical protein J132_08006 [Termitomyces sp. J132]
MRKSCLHSGRLSRSTGGKFAKKIAMKAALVRNVRAFVEQQRELARQGEPIEVKHFSLNLLTLQEESAVGGSGVAKVKSRELVESNKDDSNNNSDAIASKEEEGDVEMREMTPLAMIAEVEWEASNMEVKGEEELKVVPVATEEDKEEESAEEVKSDTPLRQVGNDKLEWLGKDLGWPTPLMSAALLADFDKRVAGVERQFQRELEAARKELLAAWAQYTVTKQMLVTLAGYWHDCQAFLAWQEENNVGEGDWEEMEAMEVPEDDADLNAYQRLPPVHIFLLVTWT